MAVVEREREQPDQPGSGPVRPPAATDRTKRVTEERRAAAGRNALIGMVRARTSARSAEHVQRLERFAHAAEPSARAAAMPEAAERSAPATPEAERGEERDAGPPAPPLAESASGSSPPAGPASGAEQPREMPDAADLRVASPEPERTELTGDAPVPDPGPEPQPAAEVVDPAVAPVLEALAAARAAAVRVREGAPVHAAARQPRARPGPPPLEPWLPLSQALSLGGQRFRPLRQVIGPLPFATSDWRPRRPHLTVPPSAWLDMPQRRRDLASDPDMPERGERFQRFRAQVEKAPPRADEEGATWTTNLPARVGLPIETRPSMWQRLLRLFRGADHPNAG